jgi:predicted HAD superfamily Cof-like phosphohydrolase
MQMDLIDEESIELAAALRLALQTGLLAHWAAALKELADLVYVCEQLAAAMGWNLEEASHRVHLSNMSKLVDGKPLLREDGKVLKGPNYRPPQLDDLAMPWLNPPAGA